VFVIYRSDPVPYKVSVFWQNTTFLFT